MFRPEFDDSKTCWHGSGIYEDCNNKLNWRNAFIRHHAGFCMWWHFYPDGELFDYQLKELHTEKASQISSGKCSVLKI